MKSVPLVCLLIACGCGEFGDPAAAPPAQSGSARPSRNADPVSTTGTGGASRAPVDAETGDERAFDGGDTPVDDPPFDDGGGSSADDPGSSDSGFDPDPVDSPTTECHPTYSTGPSRCTVSAQSATCSHNDGHLDGRLVVWQTPLGDPPAEGWPAVVVFQGSFFGPDMTWSGDPTLPFGGFNQVKLQAMLLDQGFTVIAPAASGVAWATNFPGYETSADFAFITHLLDAIADGGFGPVNTSRLYATGISSGGYMTSRMAVTYPGNFAALAIESGSYATCSNLLCAIPPTLPEDHPPTLFLHGQNDVAVPIVTAQAYYDKLVQDGFDTEIVVDPTVGHQWLDVAPEEVTCWFMTHQ